jgi:hypothetical protein
MVQTLTLAPTLASTLAMIDSDVVQLLQRISTTSLPANSLTLALGDSDVVELYSEPHLYSYRWAI